MDRLSLACTLLRIEVHGVPRLETPWGILVLCAGQRPAIMEELA